MTALLVIKSPYCPLYWNRGGWGAAQGENFGISMLASAGRRGSVVNYSPGVITAITLA